MQNNASNWYIGASPLKLISKTSWLLFAAIFALLGYEVVESSVIAQHSDNSLTLFGFILPLTTFLSATAIAVAIRSNMVLVKVHNDQTRYITSLLIWAGLSALIFGVIFYFFKEVLLSLIGFETWLAQWELHQQTLYSTQVMSYLNYRIYSLLGLFLIWQISTMLRTLGHHKSSAMLLLSWMLTKLLVLTQFIDGQSSYLLEKLGQLHFIADLSFALIGLAMLSKKTIFCFKTINTDILFRDKMTSAVLMLQQLVPPLSIAILMAIVSRVDESYIGIFSIVFRLEPLLLLFPMVLTASLPSCIGVNYWAGNKQCSYQVLRLAFIIVAVVQLTSAFILNIYLDELIAVLCPDCKLVKMITNYLAFVPYSYIGLGIGILYPSCLNAMGKSAQALFSLVFHRLLLIPGLVLMSIYSSMQLSIFSALFLAHLLAGLYVLLHFRNSKRVESATNEMSKITAQKAVDANQ